MKTPQEYLNEFFGEIQFVSCPTETKEPFFWKWTNDGKEIIESYLLTSLEEYGKQEYESGERHLSAYLAGECVSVDKKINEYFEGGRNQPILKSTRQSDNK